MHLSDVMTFGVANLPPQFKCRPHNHFLVGLFPGPRAPNAEQTQHIFKPVVDDLIRLYRDGVVINTP